MPGPARPVSKWSTEASDSGARGWAPSVDASAPSRENDHGASSTIPASTAAAVPTTATSVLRALPTTGTAMQEASAIAGTSNSAGGQKQPAIAVSSAIVT